jgi:predicted nucleic acid-binding protein
VSAKAESPDYVRPNGRSTIDFNSGIEYNTNMKRPEIVIDTNVLVAGLRSRRGAAFMLLSLVGSGRFGTNLSVPLVLEYEEVLLRTESNLVLPGSAIEDVLDYHCLEARHHQIFFLWRPYLKDPRDDMVLELAVKAESRFIVTYNLRDFAGCERFQVRPLPPPEFLRHIGVIV